MKNFRRRKSTSKPTFAGAMQKQQSEFMKDKQDIEHFLTTHMFSDGTTYKDRLERVNANSD